MTFVPATREQLLEQHHILTVDLAVQHRILRNLIPVERETKVRAFHDGVGTDKVRGNQADMASLPQTQEILKAQHEVDALQVEIENVRMQLHYS